MNRPTICFLFFVMPFIFSTGFAAEPDESGIGGTGISKPALDDGIFSRPEVPEFIDTPETPELSLPEIESAIDRSVDTATDHIETPDDIPD